MVKSKIVDLVISVFYVISNFIPTLVDLVFIITTSPAFSL